MATNHRNLTAWQAAISLAAGVYETTASLPSDEPFGLAHQLRRTAVSIPTRIADGAARHRSQEFIDALRGARTALAELETQLVIAERRHAIAKWGALLLEVGQLGEILAALIRTVSERRSPITAAKEPLPRTNTGRTAGPSIPCAHTTSE